jgi:aminoglycoside 3-N-acetyltransferase
MSDKKTITKDMLSADLRALGLESGDWVAVHSSLKSIGWVQGGPVSVIEALHNVVGPGGGIMMPLFSRPGGVRIDLAVTPTYLGIMPETFRKYPGVVRSAHPTHSVGILGPREKAEKMAEAHRHSGYISPGGPYDLLAGMGGKVLHVGCKWNTSSILHLAEVLADVPYVHITYEEWSYGVYGRHTDGSVISDVPRYVPGDSVGFCLIQEEMGRQGMLSTGRVGEADSVLASAAQMLEVGTEMLRDDPWRFLCDFDDCEACLGAKELKKELEQLGREKA